MTSSQDSATKPPGARGDAIAVVFPGQGTQQPGMATPWRDHPATARWADADAVLGRDVTRLGVAAGPDELRQPASCQVALFVHHAVLWDAWRRAHPAPLLVAGHSLGEYSALYAAGVLSFADALLLVDVRARATAEAAALRPGGMAACLGCEPIAVAAACSTAGAFLANDNAPGQVVVAGSDAALGALEAELESEPGRVRRLEVGAAYHSPHMDPAVPALQDALDWVSFADARTPVVANVDAQPHTSGSDWPALLRAQLTRPVRWRETTEALAAGGATGIVELGATSVLAGMAKRTTPELSRRFVATPQDLGVAA